MNWIYSLCCRETRKKYVVALLGRQDDQKHVLEHAISGYRCEKFLRPVSEDALATNGVELIFQSLDDNRDLHEIRGIHIGHTAAILFAVDAGNKASVDVCLSLIGEETTKTKDVVLVLCRSNIYNNEAVDEIRRMCEDIGHGKIELVVYEDSRASASISRGVNWLCNRLED